MVARMPRHWLFAERSTAGVLDPAAWVQVFEQTH